MIVDFEEFEDIDQQLALGEAADFFGSILFHPRTFDVLMLNIIREPDHEYEGMCVDIDRREFNIYLRCGKKDDDPIRTLAHEMVHVEQHVRNRLTTRAFLAKNGELQIAAFWDGEMWKPKKRQHPYYDAPWEIDAYGREEGLYQRWLEFIGDK